MSGDPLARLQRLCPLCLGVGRLLRYPRLTEDLLGPDSATGPDGRPARVFHLRYACQICEGLGVVLRSCHAG